MSYRIAYFAFTVVGIFALLVFSEKAAYAYVDPGSGLVICQSLGAMLAGAAFYLRRRLKMLFGRATGYQERS